MTRPTLLPFLKFRRGVPQQIVSHSWSDRHQILEDDVNLFCWNRTLNSQVSAYLQDITENDPDPIKCRTDISDLEENLNDIRKLWKGGSPDQGKVLWQDVYQLVSDFLVLSGSDSGTIHLRVVENDACTKFHVDGYMLRLFTTYYGQGTEWVPEVAVNRAALGTENRRIVKDMRQVRQMGTGHVGILKGELPNKVDQVRGVVHRSPEITRLGEKRIILRVDA